MKIKFKDGLIFTSIEITYQGKSKVLENIVVDTGAAKSLISQECVDDIGLKVSLDDEITISYGVGGKEHAFVKQVDSVAIDDYVICNSKLDFSGFLYEGINGLLGLDLMIKAGLVIDLKNMNIDRQ